MYSNNSLKCLGCSILTKEWFAKKFSIASLFRVFAIHNCCITIMARRPGLAIFTYMHTYLINRSYISLVSHNTPNMYSDDHFKRCFHKKYYKVYEMRLLANNKYHDTNMNTKCCLVFFLKPEITSTICVSNCHRNIYLRL